MGEKLIAACGDLWVINLPSRSDRRAEASEQLARLGLSFADGQARNRPQAHLFAACQPGEPGPFPGIGARGCFLSHLGVLRQARDAGLTRLLICEDDLDFSEALVNQGEAALDRIAREDWAIFYGYPPAGISASPTSAPELIELAPAQEMLCSHFVAFRRPAIEALVPYLEAMLVRPPGGSRRGADAHRRRLQLVSPQPPGPARPCGGAGSGPPALLPVRHQRPDTERPPAAGSRPGATCAAAEEPPGAPNRGIGP